MFLPAPAEASHPAGVCATTYTAPQIGKAARSIYRHLSPVTRPERRAVSRFRRCARTHRHARRGLGAIYKWQRWRVRNRYRLFVARLPYAGGGTRWSIPWPIVNCESGGSWSAYNPSGASGPYQLLGWGAPMPASTEATKIAHHRIAAKVWAGGAGRSNWVC